MQKILIGFTAAIAMMLATAAVIVNRNPTPAVWYDYTGTNGVQIANDLGAPISILTGGVWTNGIASTNVVGTNTLIIRNGLVVGIE